MKTFPEVGTTVLMSHAEKGV